MRGGVRLQRTTPSRRSWRTSRSETGLILRALPAWPKAVMRATQTFFIASRAGFR